MMKINNPAIDLILDIADTKQASDVLVLDVSEQCDFSDLFIIMSAETKRQIKSRMNCLCILKEKYLLIDLDNCRLYQKNLKKLLILV